MAKPQKKSSSGLALLIALAIFALLAKDHALPDFSQGKKKAVPVVVTATGPMTIPQEHQYAADVGHLGPIQLGCLIRLWNQESGWRVNAVEDQPINGNPPTYATGIPQALPADKMASAGADWRTNPRTQIRWGLGYIHGRYGTPCVAWQHEIAHDWY